MKLLLFDIDGTLLQAGPSAESSFESAFEQIFGVANCWGETIPHGRTDPDIVQEICRNNLGREISPEEYQTLTAEYVARLEPTISLCENYRVLPGVLNLLSKLEATAGVHLGLETGNIEHAAYVKLRRGSIDRFFPIGGFGSDNVERSEIVRIATARAKEHYKLPNTFSEQHVVVIGDAPQDVQAGKTFGAKTIAVATGRYSVEHLAEQQPDAVFPDLSDIPAFLAAAGIRN